MSSKKQIKFLVVGQGIAGTTLAHKLYKQGHSVHLIDNKHLSSSSLVAGGVIHPMSFKRVILSWQADYLIPYAKMYYDAFETQFKTKVFYELDMTRVFSSMEEQNNWQGRMADSPMKDIIGDEELSLDFPFGSGKVNMAGRLDVARYLSRSNEFFKEVNIISEEQFDYDKISYSETGIEYKGIEAENIIFCEGYKINQNPYFNYIPLSPTKGEILTIKTKDLPDCILSQGCYVMPIGNDEYVLGATYDRENLNQKTTEFAKEQLIEKLKKIGDFDIEVVKHRAGVRPTTHDRRPILGSHPKYNNIYIFNGLGSKGVMLAPYFSGELIDHITKGVKLNSEVSVSRYSKKHLHKCLI
jgi:glycine/D-amino acid oxidase-like deaminating enzyme